MMSPLGCVHTDHRKIRVTLMRCGTWAIRRLTAVALLALAAAGCAGVPNPAEPVTHQSTTAFSRSSAMPVLAISPFESLASYLADRAGRVTAALYDARTKQTWVLHRGVLEKTASIVKVQIMGTVLRQAQDEGRPLSAKESALIPAMIANSDNSAATALLADVGGPSAVKRFDLLAGLTDTTPSTQKYIPGTTLPGWGLTTTTALDQVRLVKRFAYSNSVLTTTDRQYGLNLMEHVEADQRWGVSGGVAPGTTVALKNGWLPLAGAGWQINSIGWISGHGRDYVLAVLTDHNPSESYGIETIDTISGRIFAELGAKPGARP